MTITCRCKVAFFFLFILGNTLLAQEPQAVDPSAVSDNGHLVATVALTCSSPLPTSTCGLANCSWASVLATTQQHLQAPPTCPGHYRACPESGCTRYLYRR